jgi:hypothetical protein
MQQNLRFNALIVAHVCCVTRSPPKDMLDVREELHRDDLEARCPFSVKDNIYLLLSVLDMIVLFHTSEEGKRRPRAGTLQPNQKVRQI